MQLKRGIERESCDFCHRRKIKCDRPVRIRTGHDSCSQCSLRQLACLLDDSGDVRIRNKRRQTNATGSHDHALRVAHRDNSMSERLSIIDSNSDVSPRAQPNPTHLSGTPSLVLLQENVPPSLHVPQVSGDDPTPEFQFLENPFELSPDAIIFLDQIFMAEPTSPLCNSEPAPTSNHQLTSLTTLATNAAAPHANTTGTVRDEPWLNCGLDPAALKDCLHAYFDLAAVCLPVLFEDAFWEDYHAGRCSPCLVLAVACRGVPFTTIPDKWEVQQILAFKFREAFLDAQRVPAGHAPVRIDDLEALALMLNFNYIRRAETSLFDQHLESLFLTHDSLVLMTMRGCTSDAAQQASSADPAAPPPTRASDRRNLLFWHVYGLDAFGNLDHKTTSRIKDGDVDVPPGLLRPQNGSYLDAILALAVIARSITERLCTVSTRRHGVKNEDVLWLYDELADWRQNRCPKGLQKPRQGAGEVSSFVSGDEAPPDPSTTDSLVIQLHRAVVWLLEINCYMQVENLVSEYGFQDAGTLRSEMVSHRVEYESLRAVDQAAELASWLGEYRTRRDGPDTTTHSLVDLAPSILRDICKGLCVWTCMRSKRLLCAESSEEPRVRYSAGRKQTTASALMKDPMATSYRKVARALRDAVATAVSHADTKEIVECLNGQISSLGVSE